NAKLRPESFLQAVAIQCKCGRMALDGHIRAPISIPTALIDQRQQRISISRKRPSRVAPQTIHQINRQTLSQSNLETSSASLNLRHLLNSLSSLTARLFNLRLKLGNTLKRLSVLLRTLFLLARLLLPKLDRFGRLLSGRVLGRGLRRHRFGGLSAFNIRHN